MKRSSLLVFLLMVLILTMASSASAASTGIKVLFGGEQLSLDVPPKLIEGRLMVPLRDFVESLGVKATWESGSKTITLTRESNTIKIVINNKKAYKNGIPETLDAVPFIIKGKTMIPLRFVGESFGAQVNWDGKNKTVSIKDPVNDLPVVGSYERLKTLLASSAPQNRVYLQKDAVFGGAAMEDTKASSAAPSAPSAGADKDYSSTNVQVQGVDEADIVKTDGKYIYQVNSQRLIVAEAYPAETMKIINTLQFDDQGFTPQEIYVDQKHLVVIGHSYDETPMPVPQDSLKIMIYPPVYYRSTMKALVYDISDKENIKKQREVELEGSYVSSRKIGSSLYLVANKYIDYYIMEQSSSSASATPSYRDSVESDKFVSIGYSDIRYFPGSVEPNYLIIAGLNLDQPEKEAQISTYLGVGHNVYASLDNLYVAVTKYDEPEVQPGSDVTKPAIREIAPMQSKTLIYKYGLDQGQVDYKGKGEVPGTILNQYSMDEDNGYFRIATTTGEVWRNDENTSKNNVYILDQGLKVTGRLENIAPGETIYSVRFIGKRGYMVTFRTVDPLFVIDLNDPKNPKILGSLKIPGYSNYIHPYDENHIIGFGKDAVEVSQKDWQGNDTTVAYYQGMKMAIFDVTDVQNPVEKFTEKIGDRGTDSELLYNPKALMFSKDKNLLAFPVTIMEVKNDQSNEGVPDYGSFAFQGAYVYNVDLIDGFKLKGKITHLTAEDYQKAANYWYDSNKNIERIIYIGDNLYTLSKEMFKAFELPGLTEINTLLIPGDPQTKTPYDTRDETQIKP